ncbi:hypothetical protein GGF46_000740 [Coemansia sp. RSA 552]|nr:hypothetical protein GGF46_000740 [Coemansia sp. RSA 552]
MSFGSKRPGGRILPVRRLTPQVDPQEQFEKLAAAIEEIYKHNASKLSYEELYRIGYGLVLSKNGPLAYDGVKGVLETHLNECVHRDILGCAEAARQDPTLANSEALLANVRLLWSEHVTAMLVIKDVLMYVDKVYVKNAHLPSVYEMGMCAFRDRVLIGSQKRLSTDVAKAVLVLIASERRGKQVDRSVLRGVADMLTELQGTDQLRTMYETALEPQLLKESQAFYHEVAKERLARFGISAYVLAAQTDLDTEMDRVSAYLAPSTATSLRNVLLEELISQHADEILDLPSEGFVQLLDQRNVESLRTLYSLYLPLPPAMAKLQSKLQNHILKLGREFSAALAPLASSNADSAGAGRVKQQMGAPAKTAMALRWVQDVLELYNIYDEFLRSAFSESPDTRKTINDAFIEIINANSRAAELLSLFIDDSLRNGLKRKLEQEIDHLLERTVLMFRFLQDKDAFEHYYKVHLARRLLLGRSQSDDAEQSLVSKLKVECGSQFTLKLEGMFRDMQLSADMAQEFRESSASNDLPFDLNVSVLTPTFWPPLAPPMSEEAKKEMHNAKPPSSMLTEATEAFSQFYLDNRSGRRLAWQYNMGSADIRVRCGGRAYEINVSTYQMFILALFMDDDEDATLTTDEIQEKTRIPAEILTRQLQSLACAKYRILAKSPVSRDVGPADRFTFNHSFKAPQYRIRIPMVAAKSNVETEKEKAASMVTIGSERQYLIEAAIVRIMKARKQMAHDQLVNETINQLSPRFLPTPRIIKDVIGKLIDREYLQRSPEDPRIYNYLA